jgi:transposase-like protein
MLSLWAASAEVKLRYVKVSGRWVYLYRAIDQFGQVIKVMVSQKRDLAATCRFVTRVLDRVVPGSRSALIARPLTAGAR